MFFAQGYWQQSPVHSEQAWHECGRVIDCTEGKDSLGEFLPQVVGDSISALDIPGLSWPGPPRLRY